VVGKWQLTQAVPAGSDSDRSSNRFFPSVSSRDNGAGRTGALGGGGLGGVAAKSDADSNAVAGARQKAAMKARGFMEGSVVKVVDEGNLCRAR
jgi:hypothetical protein